MQLNRFVMFNVRILNFVGYKWIFQVVVSVGICLVVSEQIFCFGLIFIEMCVTL